MPLKFFVDKFSHVRFEPSGWTGNQQVPYAKSIIDYIFRWLGARFLGITEAAEAGETPKLRPTEPQPQQALPFEANVVSDAPFCSECGSLMTRNGACYQVRELRRHFRLLLGILAWRWGSFQLETIPHRVHWHGCRFRNETDQQMRGKCQAFL